MHVISRKKLLDAELHHRELVVPLDVWYRAAKSAHWRSLVEVRQSFPSADMVGRFTVFNIKGNNFRLIAEIFYAHSVVLVRHVLTHAEYDKGDWKP